MPINPKKLQFASKQVINTCLRVEPDERLTVITDLETKHIADAIKFEAEKVTHNINYFVLEDFGPRPEDGSSPLKLPDEIKTALEGSTASIYCAEGKRGEIATLRRPMFEIIGKRKIRHAHMISINDEIMGQGMCADYHKIREISKKVYDIAVNTKKARVTTKLGTDFIAEFNPNWKWMLYDGFVTKENWYNLPDGEVFTCPLDVNGIAIIDGCVGDHFATDYKNIDKTPLTIKIKDSYVVDINCANKKLEEEFREYIKLDKYASRIGEFAIGTNIGVYKIIGNMAQDEKMPGVHIAVGDSFPDETGSGIASDAHCDLVMLKPTVEFDGKVIMREGKFLI